MSGRPDERDLLEEVRTGQVDEVEAYRVLDEVRERSVLPRSLELVSMSPAEWMAAARGLPLGALSRWRCDGWPVDCGVCGTEVEPDELEWSVVRDPEDPTGYGLRHAACR